MPAGGASNYREWAASVNRERDRLRRAVRRAVPEAQRAVRDLVRARIPPGVTNTTGMENTFPGYAAQGRMRTTFVASPVREEGDRIIARVGLARHARKLDYIKAVVHERGATIRPVRAKMLRFVINGEVIFAKSVRIRPKRYFRSAMEEARTVFPRVFRERLDRELRTGPR